jgi:hypothetical protein
MVVGGWCSGAVGSDFWGRIDLGDAQHSLKLAGYSVLSFVCFETVLRFGLVCGCLCSPLSVHPTVCQSDERDALNSLCFGCRIGVS